jgi:hypothetical protein
MRSSLVGRGAEKNGGQRETASGFTAVISFQFMVIGGQ